MSENKQLDTRGLLCPIPVIKTQEIVQNLPKGSLVTVIASDIGAINDIPAWCRIHGHEVISVLQTDMPKQSTRSGKNSKVTRATGTTNIEILIKLRV
ncbi:MAG: SirA family protein [Gammaproteobacteria bacterium]|nr:SirA family protein [Gammaproteobacteria bacterium]